MISKNLSDFSAEDTMIETTNTPQFFSAPDEEDEGFDSDTDENDIDFDDEPYEGIREDDDDDLIDDNMTGVPVIPVP